MANQKFKTSSVNVCLKAIKEYLDADDTMDQKELAQLKEKAKKAVDHLSTIFGPGYKNVMVYECPSNGEPTI